MRGLPRIGLGLLTAAFLYPSVVAIADGGHGGGGPRPSAQTSTLPSAGLLKSWGVLLDACDTIADDVEHGRLKSLQENAGRVPTLARALMGQLGDLSGPKRSRVSSGVTQLSKVAEHLHGAAGTGNTELFPGDLKRISRALKLISSQYAKGHLPVSSHAVAGHSKGHHD